MPPLLITFEGLDGSGKSTHLRGAREWCEERGIAVMVTQEPGGTPLGRELRTILLSHEGPELDGTTEALLVFADRRRHLEEVIEPALAAGRTVLCDRFTDSTYAYQGGGHGVPREALRQLEALATGGRRPDVTFLFDLPAETARGRSSGAAERDRLDDASLDFYRRVRDGYLTLARRESQRIRVIDSAGPLVATTAAVEAALEEIFEGSR